MAQELQVISRVIMASENHFHFGRALILPIVILFSSASAPAQSVATWTGSSGNWTDTANWSTCAPAACPVLPADGAGNFYNLDISGSNTVTFDAGGTVVNSVTLEAGETLQDNGSAPILTIGDPSSPAAGSLTNNGTMNWGNGARLILNLPASGSSVNNGTMNVTGGASLAANGEFLNYGTVDLNHASLTGSFNYNPAGYPGGTGLLMLENGSTATLTTLGTFSAGGFGFGTIVESGSALSVGTLYNYQSRLAVLSGSTATVGFIDNTNGGVLVDNSVLNVQHYSASPCCGNVIVQNGGTLSFGTDYGNPLDSTSVTGKSTLTVAGPLILANGGPFTIDNSFLSVGGDLNGTFGTIVLQNNSAATIAGSIIDDLSSITVDHSLLTTAGSVGTGGFLTVQNGGSLTVLGSFNNSVSYSNLTVNAGSVVSIGGTFTNRGTVEMDGTADILNVQGLSTNSGTVTVGSLDTLNANEGFLNSGGAVIVSSAGNLNTSNYAQDSGSTDISGTLTAGSYLQTGGNATVESGGTLSTTSFKVNGGTVRVDGTLDPTAITVAVNGALQGTGIISGNVAMGGTIISGDPGTPGTLTIDGNYEQLDGGLFDELIGQAANGVLDVSGDVTLDADSLLEITLLDGFDPLGKTFTIMNYISLDGGFSNGRNFWEDGYLWHLTYGRDSIDVRAVSTPEESSFILLLLGLIAVASSQTRRRFVLPVERVRSLN